MTGTSQHISRISSQRPMVIMSSWLYVTGTGHHSSRTYSSYGKYVVSSPDHTSLKEMGLTHFEPNLGLALPEIWRANQLYTDDVILGANTLQKNSGIFEQVIFFNELTQITLHTNVADLTGDHTFLSVTNPTPCHEYLDSLSQQAQDFGEVCQTNFP